MLAMKLKNYNNGAVGNQLTAVGRNGDVWWGVEVNLLRGTKILFVPLV
jgi:hypothetical protein